MAEKWKLPSATANIPERDRDRQMRYIISEIILRGGFISEFRKNSIGIKGVPQVAMPGDWIIFDDDDTWIVTSNLFDVI